jgi:hypothetical protein
VGNLQYSRADDVWIILDGWREGEITRYRVCRKRLALQVSKSHVGKTRGMAQSLLQLLKDIVTRRKSMTGGIETAGTTSPQR